MTYAETEFLPLEFGSVLTSAAVVCVWRGCGAPLAPMGTEEKRARWSRCAENSNSRSDSGAGRPQAWFLSDLPPGF